MEGMSRERGKDMDKFYLVIDTKTMQVKLVTKDIIMASNYATEMEDEWWRFSGSQPDLHIYEVKEVNR